VGPGLLGGSVALGLKTIGFRGTILGIGHRQASLDRALEIGAIDEASLDPASAASAKLILLATPIGQFEYLLRRMSPGLRSGTIVTDVGSTKQQVCRVAERILPRGVHFVGSHPMAGSEKRGIDFARADLCRNATCIVTPTPRTNRAALRVVRDLWLSLGMQIIDLAPAVHDRILSKISHLPHFVAAALVNACREEELKLSGMGFLDTTRVASGDIQLWHDIALSNRRDIVAAVKALRLRLGEFERAVEVGDSRRIKKFLSDAKAKRDWLVKFKIRTTGLED